jgi:hypothetical protein
MNNTDRLWVWHVSKFEIYCFVVKSRRTSHGIKCNAMNVRSLENLAAVQARHLFDIFHYSFMTFCTLLSRIIGYSRDSLILHRIESSVYLIDSLSNKNIVTL